MRNLICLIILCAAVQTWVNTSQPGDAFADVGTDPNIGAFTSSSANAYFAGDGIHLTVTLQ